MKPAPKEQPFSKLSTPPTEEFREYELPPFELLHYEEKPEGPTAEDKEEMLEIQQKIIDVLDTADQVHITAQPSPVMKCIPRAACA